MFKSYRNIYSEYGGYDIDNKANSYFFGSGSLQQYEQRRKESVFDTAHGQPGDCGDRGSLSDKAF